MLTLVKKPTCQQPSKFANPSSTQLLGKKRRPRLYSFHTNYKRLLSNMYTIITRHVEMKNSGRLGMVDAEPVGFEGPAPKTVDPLEFVVFKTDELVLHLGNNLSLCSICKAKKKNRNKKNEVKYARETSPC